MIDIGDRKLTIFHTPGHSPGHISIWDRKKMAIYLLVIYFTIKHLFMLFFPTTNPVDLVNSLEKNIEYSEYKSRIWLT